MTLHKMHSTAALKPDSSRHDNLRLVRVSRAELLCVIVQSMNWLWVRFIKHLSSAFVIINVEWNFINII